MGVLITLFVNLVSWILLDIKAIISFYIYCTMQEVIAPIREHIGELAICSLPFSESQLEALDNKLAVGFKVCHSSSQFHLCYSHRCCRSCCGISQSASRAPTLCAALSSTCRLWACLLLRTWLWPWQWTATMPSAALFKHTVEANHRAGIHPSWWPGAWPWYSVYHRCEGQDMMSIFDFEVPPWLK